jgi:hypothetical protein
MEARDFARKKAALERGHIGGKKWVRSSRFDENGHWRTPEVLAGDSRPVDDRRKKNSAAARSRIIRSANKIIAAAHDESIRLMEGNHDLTPDGVRRRAKELQETIAEQRARKETSHVPVPSSGRPSNADRHKRRVAAQV